MLQKIVEKKYIYLIYQVLNDVEKAKLGMRKYSKLIVRCTIGSWEEMNEH